MKEVRNRYCEGSADVISVCSSIDVVAVACGGEISVYRMQLNKICTASIPGTVRCLAWSPKGKALVVGSDKGAFIVNIETGGVINTYITTPVIDISWVGHVGRDAKPTPFLSDKISSNFERILLPTMDDSEPANSPISEAYFRVSLLRETQQALAKTDLQFIAALTSDNCLHFSPFGTVPAAALRFQSGIELTSLTAFYNGLLTLGHTPSGAVPVLFNTSESTPLSHFTKVALFSQIIEISNCLDTTLTSISQCAMQAESQLKSLITPPRDWTADGSLWENLFFRGPTGELADFVLQFLPKTRERIEDTVVKNVTQVANKMGGLISRGVDLISGLSTLIVDEPELLSELSEMLVSVRTSVDTCINVSTQMSNDTTHIIAWFTEMYNYCNQTEQPTQITSTPIDYSRQRIMELSEIPVSAWNRTEASVTDVTAKIRNLKGFVEAVCSQKAATWADKCFTFPDRLQELTNSNKTVRLMLTMHAAMVSAVAIEGGILIEVFSDVGPSSSSQDRFSNSSATLTMPDTPITLDLFCNKEETCVSLAVVLPSGGGTSLSNIPIMVDGCFKIDFSCSSGQEVAVEPSLPLSFTKKDCILLSCSRRDLAAVSAVSELGTSLTIVDLADDDDEDEEEEEEEEQDD